jgi:fermentation-respiration switch protein FrsA (DUF1100 family)
VRRDITFDSKGLHCVGWLYIPDKLAEGQKAPAIVLAHGFAGEKEMILPKYAEQFSRAGYVSLVFDYRYFGDSEGEPRHQLFPLDEVEDVRNAITWISDQPEVDSQRTGLWGTSFGGGIVAYTATWDRRVKAVVAQVPAAISKETRVNSNPEQWKRMGDFLLRDRIQRYKTGKINYLKVVALGTEPCIFPGKEFYDEYMDLLVRYPKSTPTWYNGVTLESLEKVREFEPVGMVQYLAPTALLLIAAENDSAIPVDAIKETYKMASEPKALSVMPIRHFEIYTEPWLTKSAGEAIDWYNKYL